MRTAMTTSHNSFFSLRKFLLGVPAPGSSEKVVESSRSDDAEASMPFAT